MRANIPFGQHVLKLNDELYGLESQTQKIEELFEDFCSSKEGGSAVVFGPRMSGKHSVVKRVTDRFKSHVEIKQIDGIMCSTDAVASRFIDNENHQKPVFVIIYNFDQFMLRSNQIFLYKVLNATRHLPVFALCITSRVDYMDLLEKRVRSRLSNNVISFSKLPSKYSDCCAAFQHFLTFDRMNSMDSVKDFLRLGEIQRELKGIYQEKGCSFALLKTIATVFYSFLEADGITNLSDEHCVEIFREAREAVLPFDDPMKTIIKSLTLRQLCLLTSSVYLSRVKRRTEFTYSEIAQTYKLFVKHNLPPLYIMDNSVLYKEMDALCALGIFEVLPCIGQISYKKTSLQIDISLVEDCLKAYPSLPTGFRKWFDEFD